MPSSLERYLASCARTAVLRERPRVVAVAGSVGKTSTKEAIGIALGASETRKKIRVSPKNYNNELGVPLTILNRNAPGRSVFAWASLLLHAILVRWGLRGIDADLLVLELGTDHPGDLEYLVGIVQPDVSVLTAIGAEHTEFFGSVENVAREERTIVRCLPKSGVAILNADDTLVREAASETAAAVVTYGMDDASMVRVVSSKIVMDEGGALPAGLEVRVVAFGLAATIRLAGVFGRPHAFAVSAALAVVFALDVDFHEAAARLQEKYHGPPGRARFVDGIKGTMLLDDSYNASPQAVESAVRDLANYPCSIDARRIATLGDMLELGPLSEESHLQIGACVAQNGIDMLVACGTLAHIIARGAREAGMPDEKITVFANSSEAGEFLQNKIRSGDVILIKGSQGVRMERITKELMAHPECAQEYLVRQTAEWLAR